MSILLTVLHDKPNNTTNNNVFCYQKYTNLIALSQSDCLTSNIVICNDETIHQSLAILLYKVFSDDNMQREFNYIAQTLGFVDNLTIYNNHLLGYLGNYQRLNQFIQIGVNCFPNFIFANGVINDRLNIKLQVLNSADLFNANLGKYLRYQYVYSEKDEKVYCIDWSLGTVHPFIFSKNWGLDMNKCNDAKKMIVKEINNSLFIKKIDDWQTLDDISGAVKLIFAMNNAIGTNSNLGKQLSLFCNRIINESGILDYIDYIYRCHFIKST